MLPVTNRERLDAAAERNAHMAVEFRRLARDYHAIHCFSTQRFSVCMDPVCARNYKAIKRWARGEYAPFQDQE